VKKQRLFYALDRMPRSVAPERLPSVRLGPAPLRLGTEPLPPDAMPPTSDHPARLAAVTAWIAAQSGPYAPVRQKFIAAYFAWIEHELAAHAEELDRNLARFRGLYAATDWIFSAFRPLPRALVPIAEDFFPVDFAFWDGAALTVILLGAAAAPPGIPTVRLTAADLAEPLGPRLPVAWHGFWRGESLPVTPFRRPMPPSDPDQTSISISRT
jgi:hypothetical protein